MGILYFSFAINAFALVVSPNPSTYSVAQITTCTNTTITDQWAIYIPVVDSVPAVAWGSAFGQTCADTPENLSPYSGRDPAGRDETVIEYNSALFTGDISSITREDLEADPSFVASFDYSYTADPPPDPLGDEIAAASIGFASTTGFNIQSVIDWSGTNLIKLFIGSGLAVIYYLRYWLVAILIISAIVYFSYRAFRFFKH